MQGLSPGQPQECCARPELLHLLTLCSRVTRHHQTWRQRADGLGQAWLRVSRGLAVQAEANGWRRPQEAQVQDRGQEDPMKSSESWWGACQVGGELEPMWKAQLLGEYDREVPGRWRPGSARADVGPGMPCVPPSSAPAEDCFRTAMA